jgi:hypothetical protein
MEGRALSGLKEWICDLATGRQPMFRIVSYLSLLFTMLLFSFVKPFHPEVTCIDLMYMFRVYRDFVVSRAMVGCCSCQNVQGKLRDETGRMEHVDLTGFKHESGSFSMAETASMETARS